MSEQVVNCEAMQEQAREQAAGYFRQGYNCAESVYKAFWDLDLTDFPQETVCIATGFGGGVAYTYNTCG